MSYLTKVIGNKEILVAVLGDEREAGLFAEALTIYYGNLSDQKISFRHKGLRSLLMDKVEIPPALAWIVESDRKHQEREEANRYENLLEPVKANG